MSGVFLGAIGNLTAVDDFIQHCNTLSELPTKMERSWAARIKNALSRKETQNKENESVRHIFALIDTDNSGTIDQEEMRIALNENQEVIRFAKKTTCLKPLLSEDTFSNAFQAMHTDADADVSLDEFLEFCSIMGEAEHYAREREQLEYERAVV